MRFAEVTRSNVRNMAETIRGLKAAPCLAEAAHQWATLCYREFEGSLPLVRVFATLDYGLLPKSNKAFVRSVAEAHQVQHLLNDKTPVLSLLGTRGVTAEWNDRTRSRGHTGIPLVSAHFIQSIPMVARLLKELGLELEWISRQDSSAIASTLGGSLAGLFFVSDASTATDAQGRHIIPARDFVASHGIKTVFGIGGAYIGGTIVVLILFTSESFDKAQAATLMPLINVFKAATTSLVVAERIFPALDSSLLEASR
jgi:hypothetical protein